MNWWIWRVVMHPAIPDGLRDIREGWGFRDLVEAWYVCDFHDEAAKSARQGGMG